MLYYQAFTIFQEFFFFSLAHEKGIFDINFNFSYPYYIETNSSTSSTRRIRLSPCNYKNRFLPQNLQSNEFRLASDPTRLKRLV